MRRSLLQTEALLHLALGPCTFDELVEILDGNPVTLRRSLRQLEAQGHVVTEEDQLKLTSSGRKEARRLKDDLYVRVGRHQEEIVRLQSVSQRVHERILAMP